jgi:hypothetical protein
MWGIIGSVAKEIIAPVTTMITGWQERKKVKLENDLAISKAVTTAKIGRLSTQQAADIAWEKTSIDNSGWKDEWFTIVLSIPAILCFIPGLAVYVEAGFRALSKTPQWYQWAFCVAVASSFGYKKLADFMALKKGS